MYFYVPVCTCVYFACSVTVCNCIKLYVPACTCMQLYACGCGCVCVCVLICISCIPMLSSCPGFAITSGQYFEAPASKHGFAPAAAAARSPARPPHHMQRLSRNQSIVHSCHFVPAPGRFANALSGFCPAQPGPIHSLSLSIANSFCF